MRLICDERERNGTIPFLPKCDNICVETLHLGDYAITLREELHYVFERKTWKDLSASLKDGRYESQILRLKELKCPVIFIIEGRMKYEKDTVIEGIEFHKLDSARRKLLMQFKIVQTKNPEHTVEFLIDFMKQYERDYLEEHKETEFELLREIKEKKKASPAEMINLIWKASGISDKLLPAFKNFSLMEFFTNQINLLNIKYTGGRAVSKKTIEKIKESQKGNIKVLSSFPSISCKSAEYILKEHKFEDLIKMPVYELKNVQKSEKSKIGQACAEKFVELLNFKFLEI